MQVWMDHTKVQAWEIGEVGGLIPIEPWKEKNKEERKIKTESIFDAKVKKIRRMKQNMRWIFKYKSTSYSICKGAKFHTFAGSEISLNIFIHSHLQIMQIQVCSVYPLCCVSLVYCIFCRWKVRLTLQMTFLHCTRMEIPPNYYSWK